MLIHDRSNKHIDEIKQAMVDVAKEVGADVVAYGCTGKGNDQACVSIQHLKHET